MQYILFLNILLLISLFFFPQYTVWNFVPKNLFEQFRRVANFYFLIIFLVQVSFVTQWIIYKLTLSIYFTIGKTTLYSSLFDCGIYFYPVTSPLYSLINYLNQIQISKTQAINLKISFILFLYYCAIVLKTVTQSRSVTCDFQAPASEYTCFGCCYVVHHLHMSACGIVIIQDCVCVYLNFILIRYGMSLKSQILKRLRQMKIACTQKFDAN